MKKIVAIGGVPGTGKSTLMRKFMSEGKWVRERPYELVDSEYDAERDLRIFGKYDEGDTFGGTDKLSMAVMPKVQEYLDSVEDGKFIFEGDRLFSYNFLEKLNRDPNVELFIIILEADQEILKARYAQRGSDQSEKFIRGRETKVSKVASSFEFMDCRAIYSHHDEECTNTIIRDIKEFLNIA